MSFKNALIKILQRDNEEVLTIKWKLFRFSFPSNYFQNQIYLSNIDENSDEFLIHFTDPRDVHFEDFTHELSQEDADLAKKYFSSAKLNDEFYTEIIVPIQFLEEVHMKEQSLNDIKSNYIDSYKNIISQLWKAKRFTIKDNPDIIFSSNEWKDTLPLSLEYNLEGFGYLINNIKIFNKAIQFISNTKVVKLAIYSLLEDNGFEFLIALLSIWSIQANLQYLDLKLKLLSQWAKILDKCKSLHIIKHINLKYEKDDIEMELLLNSKKCFNNTIGMISYLKIRKWD